MQAVKAEKWVALLSLMGVLWIATAVVAAADPGRQAGAASEGLLPTTSIVADCPPYHLDWSRGTGVLERAPLGTVPLHQWTLSLLHTDNGPQGYAKYLTWFLARDTAGGFALLWCYLNDTGREFWCWMYDFPGNLLTTHRFVGDYRFIAPPEPIAPSTAERFTLTERPPYQGADFVYKNWTRRDGMLASLSLRPARNRAAADGTPADQPLSGTPVKTLTQLHIFPLHQVKVGRSNGWRNGGWQELHVLAIDSAGDPYYGILYDNTALGFVTDLNRNQIYTADFGEKVTFKPEDTLFKEVENNVAGTSDVYVRRFERHEITLLSSHQYANPYTDAMLWADVTSPSGVKLSALGFWDGANTWRIRIAPGAVGTWTYITHSFDPDLDRQEGAFECVTGDGAEKGFVVVSPVRKRSFEYSDGTPFGPIALSDTVSHFCPLGSVGSLPSAKESSGTAADAAAAAAFKAFQQHIDACAAAGINRLVGDYLLDGPGGADPQRNEGGDLFLGNDPSRLNAAFFYWMDRRIGYCNAKGVVPDIGLARSARAAFDRYTEPQLRQLWRYVVARYSVFNVCWMLFGQDTTLASGEPDQRVIELGESMRLTNVYQHPLTVPAIDPPAPAAVIEERRAQVSHWHRGTPPPKPIPGPFATEPWLTTITCAGIDLSALDRNWTVGKPVTWLEPVAAPGAVTTEAARKRYWEARMRGAFSVVTPPTGMDSVAALTDPATKCGLACSSFFKALRFWRLAPHPELLGQPASTRIRIYLAGDTASGATTPVAPASGSASSAALAAAGATAPSPAAGAPANAAPISAVPSAGGGALAAAPTAAAPAGLASPAPGAAVAAAEQAGPSPAAPTTAAPPSSPVPAQAAAPISLDSGAPRMILADPGWEYVVYFPSGGAEVIDLVEATGPLRRVWFNPRTGETSDSQNVIGGRYVRFQTPDANDWVLYITRR